MGKHYHDLTVEQLGDIRADTQVKIDTLRIEQEKIINKLTPLLNKMRKINEALDAKTLSADDPQNLLEKFPETDARRKAFGDYIKSINLSEAGSYWVDTGQSCVRVVLYRDNDEITEKVHDGLLVILPYIKPLQDGKKSFDIFEHTLSKNYSFYLRVSENDKLFEVETHTKDVWKSSNDLMEVLKYIQKELYYEKTYNY